MEDTLKKAPAGIYQNAVFRGDNAETIRKVMEHYKNILVCGIKGVGKITRTVTAVKDNTNVYYIGNPVDFEGKRRPGSYDKYLKYILSLKKDIRIVEDINRLFRIRSNIILIIDEMYGRSESQFEQMGRLMDRENIQTFQIVGCMKNAGFLIDKVDIIIELHLDGAFTIDRDFVRETIKVLTR